MNNLANVPLARKITRLYLLALTAVALLAVGGQFWVQQALERQSSDSRVINIAGRQRMLSQKIIKTLLYLAAHPAGLPLTNHLTDLDKDLRAWQQNHRGLQNGYLNTIRTPVNNSNRTQAMLAAIQPLFKTIYINATAVSHYFHQSQANTTVPAPIQNRIEAILHADQAYLTAMNQIVFRYDAEAYQRVTVSQRLNLILLSATLLILAGEGFLVFRPAVQQINQTIGLLLSSEQRTYRANAELVALNLSLEKTREALLHATAEKYRQQINEHKLRSAYLMAGQEEERKRVALEIHDGLGQMLTALKFGIEKMASTGLPTAAAQQNLHELRGLVSQAIAEARTISFNLMPAVLNDFGIASALKLLTTQVAGNTGVNVTFNTNHHGQRLARNLEIGLYRVSQEAIHNAVKYAAAQDITVELWHKKKNIHLTIHDNGRGFSPQKRAVAPRESGPSQGISNMKERVFMINGTIRIISRPGHGTQIHVKIPLEATQYA